MKTIILQSITLVNFKGVQSSHFDFAPGTNFLCGCNGSGKTTVFDAFVWCLFDKDSQDRKTFDIKTYDPATRQVIPNIPHSVEVCLLVNDRPVKLRKAFTEKWSRTAGDAEPKLIGNKSECFIDDVPKTVTDYNNFVKDICPESIFKQITSTGYFFTLKPDAQRAFLLSLVDSQINYDDIAVGSKDYLSLLDAMSGKTIEDYRKYIAAQKKPIMERFNKIPTIIEERDLDLRNLQARIPDGCTRESIGEAIKVLESQRKSKLDALASQDVSTSEASKAYNKAVTDYQTQLNALHHRVNELDAEISQRSAEINREANAKYLADLNAYNAFIAKRNEMNSKVESCKSRRDAIQQEINTINDNLTALRTEWKSIKAETMSDDQTVCPTCHQPLPEDQVAILVDKFNAIKAQRLNDNTSKGKRLKERLTMLTDTFATIDADITNTQSAVDQINAQQLQQPKTPELLCGDGDSKTQQLLAERKSVLAKIEALPMPTAPAQSSNESIKSDIATLDADIKKGSAILKVFDDIKSTKDRLFTLDAERKDLSVKLSSFNGIEDTIDNFNRAVNSELERRVNTLFRSVTFSMYRDLINGGQEECCDAYIDNVPYRTCNKAKQVNAQLDVINVACHALGYRAPIFIDNRESVARTDFDEGADMQIINLYHDPNYQKLTLINN